MTAITDPVSPTTVSRHLIEDWLEALRRCCSDRQVASFLRQSGLGASGPGSESRVTLDQIVSLYQLAAVESGDEMMGLWSRPIRARALQHLLTTVQEADSLPAALFRFSTFWNLLLDDYRLDQDGGAGMMRLDLVPLGDGPVQRFGHLLMLKLAHGVLSWLVGEEIAIRSVDFAFARPDFAEDYAVMFPAPVRFDAARSGIAFERVEASPLVRSKAELVGFVTQAPRDWLFTRQREHNLTLRIRRHIHRVDWAAVHLDRVADAFGMTPRTLIRRLADEGTSFRAIRDSLRRDVAIRDLSETAKSIEQISHDLGFSSAANFHRAFRRWTGETPGMRRRASSGMGIAQGLPSGG